MATTPTPPKIIYDIQSSLFYLYGIKPSLWTLADTLRLHKFIDEVLSPYLDDLWRGYTSVPKLPDSQKVETDVKKTTEK